MRLPAVAIASAFAIGIGLWPAVASRANSAFLAVSFAAATAVIAAAMALALRERSVPAGIFALLGWMLLGLTATTIAHQPAPSNYVLNLIGNGSLDIHSPLRWHGTMRDEPAACRGGNRLRSS